MRRFFALCAFVAGLGPAAVHAQSTATYQVGGTTLTLSTLTTGLNTPWELLWGPDNFLWMTERSGRISRIDPATGQAQLLLTIPDVLQNNESGLLGMAIVPSLALPVPPPLQVFVVYNYAEAGGIMGKLVRYTYQNGTLGSPQTLLTGLPANTIHNGSRLLVQPDGTLLMTLGDAGNTALVQNPQSLAGKVLRLNPDGTAPADNPTPGSLVYSLGHRNPQGLVRVPATGRVYSSEHGPSNDDEINLIEAGRNYGWPAVAGYCNLPAEQAFCQPNNVREPLAAWTPTRGVCGLSYYDHPAIPEWRNNLLLVSLIYGGLTALPLAATGTQLTGQSDLWAGTYGRLRAICVSPQGRIYLTTSNRDGRAAPGPQDDRILVLENRAYTPNAATARGRDRAVAAFPNPATHQLTLSWSGAAGQPKTVSVINTLGQRLYRATPPAGAATQLVPTAAWPVGSYVALLHYPSGETVARRFDVVR